MRDSYKKIYDLLPETTREDWFGWKNYANNSLTNYRKLSYSKKIFSVMHNLIKHITLFGNMLDRKLARIEDNQIARTLSKRKEIIRNVIFNNKHKGKRCFIVANGPSLKNQDLSFLKNEINIATNTIWKHPLMKVWRPTYYCTAHTEPFYDTEKDLGVGFENPTVKEGREYFKNIREILYDSIYFIPYHGYEGNKKLGLLPTERTFYTAFLPYPLYEMMPEFPNLTHGLPTVQDSSQYAIMLALAMGCSTIYLLGCDHDWFVNLGVEKLFFEGSPVSENGKKFDSSKIPMIDNMWFAWVLWRGHIALRKMAEKFGVEIINATGGGVLDVYKTAKYEDLFKKN
jgi:hypothetical protein